MSSIKGNTLQSKEPFQVNFYRVPSFNAPVTVVDVCCCWALRSINILHSRSRLSGEIRVFMFELHRHFFLETAPPSTLTLLSPWTSARQSSNSNKEEVQSVDFRAGKHELVLCLGFYRAFWSYCYHKCTTHLRKYIRPLKERRPNMILTHFKNCFFLCRAPRPYRGKRVLTRGSLWTTIRRLLGIIIHAYP